MRFTVLLTTTSEHVVVVDLDSYKQLDGRYNLDSCIVAGHKNFNKECSCIVGECSCVGFVIYEGILSLYKNRCKLLYSFISPAYYALEFDIDLF